MSFSRVCAVGFPLTLTRYSFSCVCLGWVSFWIKSPSVERIIKPSESLSRRPAGLRFWRSFGSKSRIVSPPWGSCVVER